MVRRMKPTKEKIITSPTESYTARDDHHVNQSKLISSEQVMFLIYEELKAIHELLKK